MMARLFGKKNEGFEENEAGLEENETGFAVAHFSESLKLLTELQHKEYLETPILSLTGRIQLAKDIIRSGNVKEREELEEIEGILKELRRQKELERLGFREMQRPLLSESKLSEAVSFINHESVEAEADYLETIEEVKRRTKEYIEAVEPGINKLLHIQNSYSKLDLNLYRFMDTKEIQKVMIPYKELLLFNNELHSFAKALKNLKGKGINLA